MDSYINPKFSEYEIIDIDISNMNFTNDEPDYKTLKAIVNINNKGLKIYSEEIDTTWFYKRHKNDLIEEEGILLLQKLPISNNECIITVKNTGYDSSPWISTNNEWWIDTELTFS